MEAPLSKIHWKTFSACKGCLHLQLDGSIGQTRGWGLEKPHHEAVNGVHRKATPPTRPMVGGGGGACSGHGSAVAKDHSGRLRAAFQHPLPPVAGFLSRRVEYEFPPALMHSQHNPVDVSDGTSSKVAHPSQPVSHTTNVRCQSDYQGSLDFAFLVHARDVNDIRQTYPHLKGCDEDVVFEHFGRTPVHVGAELEVRFGDTHLRGELIGVPLHPRQFRRQLVSVRESLKIALEYLESRGTKIAGLGALLPSLTQYGRILVGENPSVGITTGHSFTAHCIAEQVRQIEELLGETQAVAVVGAAGSTGQAVIKALGMDKVERVLTLIDLPERQKTLEALASEVDASVQCSSDLSAIKQCSVVVCVTNSPSAILRSEHLGDGCIVIDDAQPENIAYETVRERPDVTVVKCLAHIPHLHCPFDFRLLPPGLCHADKGITFTCLAETVALALSRHVGHFTIGAPTYDQIRRIAEIASSFGIGVAPFHSFPQIGPVHDLPRFKKLNGNAQRNIPL